MCAACMSDTSVHVYLCCKIWTAPQPCCFPPSPQGYPSKACFFSSSSSKRSFYSGLPHAAVKWQYRQTTEQQLKTTEENKVTKGCESSITADESNYFLTLKITIDQVKNVEEDRVFSLVVTFTITGGNKYKVWQGNVFFFLPCFVPEWTGVESPLENALNGLPFLRQQIESERSNVKNL